MHFSTSVQARATIAMAFWGIYRKDMTKMNSLQHETSAVAERYFSDVRKVFFIIDSENLRVVQTKRRVAAHAGGIVRFSCKILQRYA